MKLTIYTVIEAYEEMLDLCDNNKKVVKVNRRDLHDLLTDHHIMYAQLRAQGTVFPEDTNIPILAGGRFDPEPKPLPSPVSKRQRLDDEPVRRERLDEDVDNPPKRNRL